MSKQVSEWSDTSVRRTEANSQNAPWSTEGLFTAHELNWTPVRQLATAALEYMCPDLAKHQPP